MADAALFLALLSASFSMAASQKQSNISRGSSLTPTSNSSWLSSSGLYAFAFYPRDNGYGLGAFLAGIPQKTVVWTFDRDSSPFPSSATLQFTSDGRLVLQSSATSQSTDVADGGPFVSASMLDSGNFVLFGQNQDIAWQTFDYPTDTLLPGQNLSAGGELKSSTSDSDQSTGIFRLELQHDGNLVQYPIDVIEAAVYAYWSSNTAGIGDNAVLHLDNDGFLYISNAAGKHDYNFTQQGLPSNNTIYMARMDADGIFRLYSYDTIQNGNWSILWSSSDDKCSPKGICGFNMYCLTSGQEVECVCLPGFAPVEEGNSTLGCARSFALESCNSTSAITKFSFQSVANIVWVDDSYWVQSLSSNKECQASCTSDCNCAAAVYNDGQCRKQGLPLRYGKRDLNSSNIVSIKLSEATSDANEPRQSKGKHVSRAILVTGISLITFSLAILVSIPVLVYRNCVLVHRMHQERRNIRMIEDVGPRSFSYEELRILTKEFKEEIGKGAFGTVYKGTLQNQQKVIAVKKLENISSEGEREFETEVRIIGRTYHRNLVQLLGYCLDGSNRLLVYEYMSNGSLADMLFTPEKQPNWDEKLGLACNIARGLLYLHHECETQIIHCDIKPQNILIDDHRHAKISDFGLSKLLNPDQTRTTTRIRGTRGYVAPEWHKNQPVTVKADVYSFGVVLLEIVCNRKSLDWGLAEEEAVLEEWVHRCFHADELEKLVTGDGVDRQQLERMVKVALWCILEEPALRPSMRKVMLMLEGTVDVPNPPISTSFLNPSS